MCGVAGEIRFNQTPVDPDTLIAMRDTMEHRGPDGSGIWIAPSRDVGFVHRRLSIVDPVPAASQPMWSEDDRYCLTFNGEIYNHQEIRRELIAEGVTQWRTNHSDTEVILRACIHWGPSAIEKFRGMFAFGFWDAHTRELYLVRDRVGIKPLYYTLVDHSLLFASEIKALLKNPRVQPAINEEGFFHYLSFLTTPAPQTMFNGIYKVPPATCLKIDRHGNIKTTLYWDPLDQIGHSASTHDEFLADLNQNLHESITLHQSPDAPMGIFLSGGLDSSLCTALFSKTQSRPLKTYSIGYSESTPSCPSELPFAWQMAKHVGAEFYEKKIARQEFLDFLPQLIDLQDEPIADPVCVPVHFVAKLAASAGIKVCQVGEGSDELFLGYPNWKFHLDLERWSALPLPSSLKRLVLGGLGQAGYRETFKFEALRRTWNDELPFWSGTEAFTESQKRQLLSPHMRERFASLSSFAVIEPIRKRFMNKAENPNLADWMSYVDLNLRLPELLLMRVDKMTMGASIESRVPFLDHKLVECAFRIPRQFKIHGETQKVILKEAARGLVPDALIDRKKQGFGVPLEDWLLTDFRKILHDEVKSFCSETGLLDWREVETYFKRNRFVQIWVLFNLARWWKRWL